MADNNCCSKVVALEDVKATLAEQRSAGKTAVHCHGVFDLVHLGHIRHLNAAKKHGDLLVVTLTADEHVKRGPGRPIFSEDLRAETLANLEIVDCVAVVPYPSAVEAIEAVAPDFYVKGSDYKAKEDDVTAMIYEEERLVNSLGGQLVFTDEITFSSSQLINTYVDPLPNETADHLKKLAETYPADKIVEMLKKIDGMRILVIGDAILDQYRYCSPMGKSGKENIVVNKYISEELFAGGAMAIANHTAQVSTNIEMVTVLGKQDSHEEFIKKALNENIKPHFFYRTGCQTTVKRRYINEDASSKLFEVYYFDDSPLDEAEQAPIVDFLEKRLPDFDLVIVCDYGHGMLTKEIRSVLCSSAKCLAVNVQVNSANRGFNFVTKYHSADFVCIDEAEMRLATQDKFEQLSTLSQQLAEELDCKQLIVTRGAKGSLAYNPKDGFSEAPAFSFKSVDKVGAGDAFFAYTAPCFAAGYSQELISFIGNAVGVLAIQVVGNREPVMVVDLMKFITRLMKF